MPPASNLGTFGAVAVFLRPQDDRLTFLADLLDTDMEMVQAWFAGTELVPDRTWRLLSEALRQNAVENARLNYLVMKELYP